MCYDVKATLESQLKRAKRNANEQAIREIQKKLIPLTDLPLFHGSGFQHPKLLIYTELSPSIPVVSSWGLIPHWVKDSGQRKKIWNTTLNARGESIFEKPAFRDAALRHHCIIPVDGFYEHHHFRGRTYPYFVYLKNKEPMSLAGLWNEWTDPETGEIWNTFAIVTTNGNPMMARIHNNPKLDGPRMPVILPEELADSWLSPAIDELDRKALQELIISYPEEAIDAHTVKRLRGKDSPGNVEGINEAVTYSELIEDIH